MRIQEPGWKKFGSGREKIRIRDKNPGSATLQNKLGIIFLFLFNTRSYLSHYLLPCNLKNAANYRYRVGHGSIDRETAIYCVVSEVKMEEFYRDGIKSFSHENFSFIGARCFNQSVTLLPPVGRVSIFESIVLKFCFNRVLLFFCYHRLFYSLFRINPTYAGNE
jgi:hypothetical protein